MATTLRPTSVVLADIIQAFKKQFPALNYMGTDFRNQTLKKGQTYIAHIPSLPSAQDVSTTYAVTANATSSLLTDVSITPSTHKYVRLTWSHFDAIQYDKLVYQQHVDNAAYVLVKSVMDDLISGVTSEAFSQSRYYADTDADVDMLIDLCGLGNTNAMLPTGRVLLVNTAVANVLAADSRLSSTQVIGGSQGPGGNGYRRWVNTNGFAEIIEYPDLTNTTSGTALTSCASTASTDTIAKTAHGLATGQKVTAASFSAGTGLTSTGGTYYVIRVDADSFKLASSAANALAGTAYDISADGTGGSVTPTQNLSAFAFDQRAFALLAGIPDDFNQGFVGAPINRVMSYEPVTVDGITMAGVGWQDTGTGLLNWGPTMIWGKALGRQAATNGVGGLVDYAGIRVTK